VGELGLPITACHAAAATSSALHPPPRSTKILTTKFLEGWETTML